MFTTQQMTMAFVALAMSGLTACNKTYVKAESSTPTEYIDASYEPWASGSMTFAGFRTHNGMLMSDEQFSTIESDFPALSTCASVLRSADRVVATRSANLVSLELSAGGATVLRAIADTSGKTFWVVSQAGDFPLTAIRADVDRRHGMDYIENITFTCSDSRVVTVADKDQGQGMDQSQGKQSQEQQVTQGESIALKFNVIADQPLTKEPEQQQQAPDQGQSIKK